MIKAPAYPKGDVAGPCVCGSWPGGRCLKCKRVVPPAAHLFRSWAWAVPAYGRGDYHLCTDGIHRHVRFPNERAFRV